MARLHRASPSGVGRDRTPQVSPQQATALVALQQQALQALAAPGLGGGLPPGGGLLGPQVPAPSLLAAAAAAGPAPPNPIQKLPLLLRKKPLPLKTFLPVPSLMQFQTFEDAAARAGLCWLRSL